MNKFVLKILAILEQRAIAENLNTPPEILTKLANDEEYSVRLRVARNPNTPLEVLERLANDKDWDIHHHVAYNPNTPKYINTYLRYQQYKDYVKDQ